MGRSKRLACSGRQSSSKIGKRLARGCPASARLPPPTMTTITPTVSCGLVDGRPVFADIQEDSYFMLEPDEESVFLAKLRAYSNGDDLHLEVGRQHLQLVNCAPPEASVLQNSILTSRPALRDLIAVWWLLAAARRSIRVSTIAETLGKIKRRKQSPPRNDKVLKLAERFVVARKLVPIPRNCLADSVALLRWLARHGERATLVFGVKLDPFAAHCWVQTDAVLLNDHLEHVERFTPVRTVPCTVDLP